MANRKPLVDVSGRLEELPVGDALVDGSGNPIGTGGGGSPGGVVNSLQTNDGAGGFAGYAGATLVELVDGMQLTLGFGGTEATITKTANSLDVASSNFLGFSAAGGYMEFYTPEGGGFSISDEGDSAFNAVNSLFLGAGLEMSVSGITLTLGATTTIDITSGPASLVTLTGGAAVASNTAGGGVKLSGGNSKGNQSSAVWVWTAVAGTSGNIVRTAAAHFGFDGLAAIQQYDTSNKWTATIGSTGALTWAGTGTGASLTITPTSGQNIHLKPQSTGLCVIGDGTTNYTAFDASGIMTLYGTAKVTHHMQIPVTAALVSGSAVTQYGSTCVAGMLANQNTDQFFFQTELFTGWDGTDCYIEVDWLPATDITDTQTVIWQLAYRSIAEGEDVDSFSDKTITLTYTSSGTTSAGKIIHSRFTMAYNDATAPLTAEDHQFYKIYRDATADTYGGNCIVTAFEFIWIANKLSRA